MIYDVVMAFGHGRWHSMISSRPYHTDDNPLHTTKD